MDAKVQRSKQRSRPSLQKSRPRKAYIEEIIRQADCNQYVDMKRLAFNREE
jgi:hypothetical protein